MSSEWKSVLWEGHSHEPNDWPVNKMQTNDAASRDNAASSLCIFSLFQYFGLTLAAWRCLECFPAVFALFGLQYWRDYSQWFNMRYMVQREPHLKSFPRFCSNLKIWCRKHVLDLPPAKSQDIRCRGFSSEFEDTPFTMIHTMKWVLQFEYGQHFDFLLLEVDAIVHNLENESSHLETFLENELKLQKWNLNAKTSP